MNLSSFERDASTQYILRVPISPLKVVKNQLVQ